MWLIILKTIYFALPAFIANMAPILAKKWTSFLNVPVDFNYKIKGENIFGQNKTWRGFISAPIAAIFITGIQAILYQNFYFNKISIIDYPRYWLLFGFLAGMGTILGDLIKSFFKRRLKIKPGGSLPVFDQIDYLLGFIIFTYFISSLEISIIIVILAMGLILNPIANLIAYKLGFKKVWW